METGSLKLTESCPALNQELHGLWDQADCCPMLSWTAKMCLSREGKGREGKGGKGMEGKGREGKGRDLHKATGMMKKGISHEHVWMAIKGLHAA